LRRGKKGEKKEQAQADRAPSCPFPSGCPTRRGKDAEKGGAATRNAEEREKGKEPAGTLSP